MNKANTPIILSGTSLAVSLGSIFYLQSEISTVSNDLSDSNTKLRAVVKQVATCRTDSATLAQHMKRINDALESQGKAILEHRRLMENMEGKLEQSTRVLSQYLQQVSQKERETDYIIHILNKILIQGKKKGWDIDNEVNGIQELQEQRRNRPPIVQSMTPNHSVTNSYNSDRSSINHVGSPSHVGSSTAPSRSESYMGNSERVGQHSNSYRPDSSFNRQYGSYGSDSNRQDSPHSEKSVQWQDLQSSSDSPWHGEASNATSMSNSSTQFRNYGSDSFRPNSVNYNDGGPDRRNPQMHDRSIYRNPGNPTRYNMSQSHMNQTHMNQPHTNQTHMNQPHTNQLHMNQPHINQPHTNQPHINQSHINQAHMNQAHMNQAHMNQPHMNQAHMNQPHMNQSHMNQAHMNQPHMNQSRMNHRSDQNANLPNFNPDTERGPNELIQGNRDSPVTMSGNRTESYGTSSSPDSWRNTSSSSYRTPSSSSGISDLEVDLPDCISTNESSQSESTSNTDNNEAKDNSSNNQNGLIDLDIDNLSLNTNSRMNRRSRRSYN